MRILIIEDEPPIAEYIEDNVRKILGNELSSINVVYTLDDAILFLKNSRIDLCMLDLNLKGKSGYDLLKYAASLPFHTIIISAYTDKAITAFEYGVIDFIPKPFDLNRLRLAFDRYFGRIQNPEKTKYLVFRKMNMNILLSVKDIIYIKSEGYLTKAYSVNNNINLLEKTLKHLEVILPANFIRIHRSYLVNIDFIKSYQNIGGGVYNVELKNGKSLPLSRNGLKLLRQKLSKYSTNDK
jgi:two-component system response regulator LytT